MSGSLPVRQVGNLLELTTGQVKLFFNMGASSDILLHPALDYQQFHLLQFQCFTFFLSSLDEGGDRNDDADPSRH